jgi:hypothetical protein
MEVRVESSRGVKEIGWHLDDPNWHGTLQRLTIDCRLGLGADINDHWARTQNPSYTRLVAQSTALM